MNEREKEILIEGAEQVLEGRVRRFIGHGYEVIPERGDDLTPVVRCMDCKQYDPDGGYMGRGWCGYQMKITGPTYYCADGEREDDAADDPVGKG